MSKKQMIPDENVIACIQERMPDGVRFDDLCAMLAIKKLAHGLYGGYTYSLGATALANQLQRLKRGGKIKTGRGQRWIVNALNRVKP